jgi:hypothetical protein
MPVDPVTDADLQQLWTDLAKVQGPGGYQAVWKMILLDKKVATY